MSGGLFYLITIIFKDFYFNQEEKYRYVKQKLGISPECVEL